MDKSLQERFIKYLRNVGSINQENCEFFLKYAVLFFALSCFLIVNDSLREILGSLVWVVKLCSASFAISILFFLAGAFYARLQLLEIIEKEFLSEEESFKVEDFNPERASARHFECYLKFGLLLFGLTTLLGLGVLSWVAWKI